MNAKGEYLKSSERIIYLILIVALVISLITISTCNRSTLDENFYIKSQVEVLNSEMNDLELIVNDKDSALFAKAKEIKLKKEEISKLISEGKISAAQANKEIKALRAQLKEINEEVIIQKSYISVNTDSFNNIISNLQYNKRKLESEIAGLQAELNKPVLQKTEVKEDFEIEYINITEAIIDNKNNTVFINCSLNAPATKNETFYVYIFDEYNNMIPPQYSIPILKGQKSYSGTSNSYQKGTFKAKKTYLIVIKNSKNKEIAKSKQTLRPKIDILN